jgi:hypothetical protein
VSLLPWVTLLQFNTANLINNLPEGFIIESANLQLSIDRTNTFFDPEFGAFLNILKLTSDVDSGGVVVDSSVLGSPTYTIDMTRLSDDSSYVEVNLGTERNNFGQLYIQDRVDNLNTTKKLYVGFKSNIDFFSYIALFKNNHPDLNKRPRLILNYWIPPNSRY